MLTLTTRGLETFVQGPFEEKKILSRILTFEDPSAERSKAYKSGFWDGSIRLYDRDQDMFLSGLVRMVRDGLRESGVESEVVDERPRPPVEKGVPADLFPGIQLRDYQVSAIRKGLLQGGGICKIPTRGGKTFVAAGFLKLIGLPSIFLVGQVQLLRQTCQVLRDRLGFSSIGKIGDGIYDPGFHTVVTVQSAYELLRRRDSGFLQLLQNIKVLVIDECQHTAALSWEVVARSIPADYRFGLSGTPYKTRDRGSYEDYLLLGICGPPCSIIPTWTLVEQGWIAQPLIYLLPVTDPCKGKSWAQVYEKGIVTHPGRNRAALLATQGLVSKGHQTLILVQRKEHGKAFLQTLAGVGISAVFLMGGDVVWVQDGEKVRETRDVVDGEISRTREEFRRGEHQVLIATSVLDEGVDLPEVGALVLLSGGKSFVKTLQRLGRALCPKPGDNQVFIVDFCDRQHYWLQAHSRAREKEYLAERHTILGAAEFWGRFSPPGVDIPSVSDVTCWSVTPQEGGNP